MLERAERASHIDPPASSYAIMQRASPYCGENPGPGKDVRGELEPRPGIREQPGSTAPLAIRAKGRPCCIIGTGSFRNASDDCSGRVVPACCEWIQPR